MTDATIDIPEDAEDAPKKKSKKPLLIGLLLALILGGGGFYAVQSGLILSSGNEAAGSEHADDGHGSTKTDESSSAALPEIAFVPIDPLIISLGPNAGSRHLRFRAQLEVDAGKEAAILSVMPRIVDVLNGYLRAVHVKDLETPSALFKLRSQMLRRIELVAGEGRVRDLLIMEFILN